MTPDPVDLTINALDKFNAITLRSGETVSVFTKRFHTEASAAAAVVPSLTLFLTEDVKVAMFMKILRNSKRTNVTTFLQNLQARRSEKTRQDRPKLTLDALVSPLIEIEASQLNQTQDNNKSNGKNHGMPEGIRIKRQSKYDAGLYEVLAAYSTQRLRNYYEKWSPPKMDVLSIERARMRIERLLGKLDDWETMDALIAGDIRDPQKRRTTMASSFSAFLEYARDGRVELQQGKNFDSLLVRRARPKAAETGVK